MPLPQAGIHVDYCGLRYGARIHDTMDPWVSTHIAGRTCQAVEFGYAEPRRQSSNQLGRGSNTDLDHTGDFGFEWDVATVSQVCRGRANRVKFGAHLRIVIEV